MSVTRWALVVVLLVFASPRTVNGEPRSSGTLPPDPAPPDPAPPDPAAAMERRNALSRGVRTQRTFAEPVIKQYRLSNGLRVVLQSDERLPAVTVAVRYASGSRDNPQGYQGLAHLVEHLTFTGTQHAPEGFRAHYRASAAQYNGSTAPHDVFFHGTTPVGGMERLLWVERERMGFVLSALNQDKLNAERRIVELEMGQRQTAALPSILDVGFYGRAASDRGIGWQSRRREDRRAISLPNVQWYIQSVYRPDNAVLVVVGNMDLAETAALVEKHFGPLKNPGIPKHAPAVPALRTICGGEWLEVAASVRKRLSVVAWALPTAEDRAQEEARWLLGLALAAEVQRRLAETGATETVNVVRDFSAEHERLAIVTYLDKDDVWAQGRQAAKVEKIVLSLIGEWVKEGIADKPFRSARRARELSNTRVASDSLRRAREFAALAAGDVAVDQPAAVTSKLRLRELLRRIEGTSVALRVDAAPNSTGISLRRKFSPCE